MTKTKKISQPKVSIVFVTWNGKDYTFDLIDSLRKIDYKNYDIIVVDNGSTDGTQREFKKKYKKVATIIENGKNLGLAEGLNVGIREGLRRNSKYVLVMNNDMIVKKDFLNYLVDSMEKHPEVSVSGPKMYFFEPKNMIYGAGCDYHMHGFRARHTWEIDVGQADEEKYVDEIDCVLMMRSDVLRKCGLFESRFFLFHELTEWCLRTKKLGYKCWYAPKAVLWHKESVSPAFEGTRNERERATYYMTRNWLLTIRKNKNYLYYLMILFLQSTAFAFVRFAKFLKHKQFYLVKIYYIAIWHALINKTPMKLYPYKK